VAEDNELVGPVQQVEYHRNGVGGDPFWVVTFTSAEDGRPMVGIVFSEQYRTAVFNRELLGQGVIAFGQNSFRGDCFDAELRAAICKDQGCDPFAPEEPVEQSESAIEQAVRELLG
jgi:hypothetical protein